MRKNQIALLRYARNHVLDVHDLKELGCAMGLVKNGYLRRKGKKRVYQGEIFKSCTFSITEKGMTQLYKIYPHGCRGPFSGEEIKLAGVVAD